MIVATPGTIGGKPRIDGRRIGVHVVVIARQQGMGDDEIAYNWHLTPEQITEALDYYAAHAAEIDAIIERETAP